MSSRKKNLSIWDLLTVIFVLVMVLPFLFFGIMLSMSHEDGLGISSFSPYKDIFTLIFRVAGFCFIIPSSSFLYVSVTL
ncbi:hypothetical protein CTKA_01085 [Chthonomonas calidirosea]|uniref:Uncharacterized protein n=1 Tax=Chthonomonas calidirosea (strain DSM 23976 / ICMP 18418 / T49) TaxID=1303518 RepID=S0EUB8_CHTCT|nr:hypothetical protein CCALI_00073 [Chthonomonas calidirosea T49]CEK16301.1 hypothetical protein CTKA_01085 [Chthonomonas calidirosea]